MKNRILHPSIVIRTTNITECDEAQFELYQRGWSIRHTAIDGDHQVYCYKQESRIVANAPNELEAWLLACEKANEQEQLWMKRYRVDMVSHHKPDSFEPSL